MKIKPDTDLREFFSAVTNCTGPVTYRTSEGDEINLKSHLSQYFVAMAFLDKELSVTGNVVCANEKDMPYLKNFLYK